MSINGQGDGTNPKAIARTFIQVAPSAVTGMDWYEGFDAPIASFMDQKCADPAGNCWQQFRQVSTEFDGDFTFTETARHSFAPVAGELWAGLADVGADVGGKFRITPTAQAQMAADTYLYTTMETDTFTTGRRYPQIIISDQPAPIDYVFSKGQSLVIQTFNVQTASWPNQFEVEVCDKRNWDVNDQCPAFHELHENLDPTDATKAAALSPAAEAGEHSTLDRSTLWEVYASTKRVYLFLDGQPYGCANMPTTGVPSGPVSVTFGFVLYHSGVDDIPDVSTFLTKHGQIESHRHLDNLAFKSGSASPPWDEKLFPCALASQMSKGQ